jgi:hypothetical protein
LEVVVTVASAPRTATVHHRRRHQGRATVAVLAAMAIGTGTAIVADLVVGMTRAAAVAHMMTDLVAVTEADLATGTDAAALTSNRFATVVTVVTAALAITIGPEMTTAGNVDTTVEDMRTLANRGDTDKRLSETMDAALPRWWVSSILSACISPTRLSFSRPPIRVSKSKTKIANAHRHPQRESCRYRVHP